MCVMRGILCALVAAALIAVALLPKSLVLCNEFDNNERSSVAVVMEVKYFVLPMTLHATFPFSIADVLVINH